MVDFGAATTTAASGFDHGVVVLIERVLEERLRNPLLHLMPGNFVPATFVKGTNGTLRFRNIPDLTRPTAASMATPVAGTAPWLTEGTTPTVNVLTFGYEEFTSYQAGNLIGITDKAIIRDPVDLVAEGVNVISFDAVKTMDERVAQVLLAGTNVLYAGAATNAATTDVAAGDVLKGQLIKRGVAKLRRASIPAFGEGYRSILDPGVEFDIQSDDDIGGWIDAARYAGADAIKSGLIGQYAGVQFSQSAAAGRKVAGGAGAIDVYSTIIFGTKSYSFGDWGTVELTVTPPGGHSDPMKLSAIVSWKADFGAMLLGEGANVTNASPSRYIRFESASNV
jgi:N4-gp56 family major capsid protein